MLHADRKIHGVGVTLVLVGALNKKHVEPDAYIELMEQIKHKDLFKTKFYSSGNAADGLDNREKFGFSRMTWIPHEELEHELQNAYVLLSLAQLQGKQISSKIFEYMSCGKPILHIYYKEEDVNLKYLKKYPLSLFLKADDIPKRNANYIEERMLRLSWLSFSFDDLADDFKCMTPQYLANELVKQ